MKKALRKTGLEKRNRMTKSEVETLSKQIIKVINSKFNLDKYQIIGFYLPLGNEVDLRPLIKELIELGKTIVLPKVLDKHTMEFFPIKDLNDHHIGRFNVLEPNSNKKIPKNEIEIIFVPGIYFSYQNYRIGFGAGFYDRYFAQYHNKKVGVCYAFQYVPNIPYNDYDIPMDQIITENPLHLYHDED
jgi:5-formyltetrahydrofolate cyclo-ligase